MVAYSLDRFVNRQVVPPAWKTVWDCLRLSGGCSVQFTDTYSKSLNSKGSAIEEMEESAKILLLTRGLPVTHLRPDQLAELDAHLLRDRPHPPEEN